MINRCAVKGCSAEAVWRIEYGGRTVAGQVTAELGSCRPHLDELRNVLTPYAVTEYRERPDGEPGGYVFKPVTDPEERRRGLLDVADRLEQTAPDLAAKYRASADPDARADVPPPRDQCPYCMTSLTHMCPWHSEAP